MVQWSIQVSRNALRLIVNKVKISKYFCTLILLSSSLAQAAVVDIFVFRSSTRINFETPRTLFVSTLKSYLKAKWMRLLPEPVGNANETMLGHVSLNYNCACSSWKEPYPMSRSAGQSGQKHQQGMKLVMRGAGIMPLISVFTDGVLEADPYVQNMVSSYKQHDGALRILRLKTSCDTCKKLAKFIYEYEQGKAYENYTLVYQPKEFHLGKSDPDTSGGGCGSFVAGALERSGIWGKDADEVFRAFSREYWVPMKLINPVDVPFSKLDPLWANAIPAQPASHSPLEMFFSSHWKSWGNPNDADSRALLVVDPEWFYDWINGAILKGFEKWGFDLNSLSRRSSLALWVGSSGSVGDIQGEIAAQELRGAQWIAPYLEKDRVQWIPASKSPYYGAPILEVDI